MISQEELEVGKAQAIAAASKAALRNAGTLDSLFSGSVTHVDAFVEHYSRCAHQIVRREVYLRLKPAAGLRARDLLPPPDPTIVDPWSVEPEHLERETMVPTKCPTCDGAKKVACSTCKGSKRVRCGECGGGGRVQGQKGLKKCGSCQGRGDRKCSYCSAGRVTCGSCEGNGRVFAFLAVRSSKQVRVVHDASLAPEVHGRIAEPEDFGALSSIPALVTSDSGWRSGDVPAHLRITTDPKLDRLVSSRVQTLQMPVYDVHYQTLLGQGQIRVLGRALVVGRGAQWAPWTQVMVSAGVAAVIVFFLLSVLRASYVQSHAWHATLGAGNQLLVPTLVAPLCVALATVALLSGRRSWSLLRLGMPSFATALCLIAVPVVAHSARPTGAQAREYLERGEIANAALTAEATIKENPGDVAAGEVLDAILSERLDAAKDISEASHLLGQEWRTDAALQAATATFRVRSEREVESLISTKDASALEALASIIFQQAPDVARNAAKHGYVLQSDIAIAEHRFGDALAAMDLAIKVGLSQGEVALRRERIAGELDGEAISHFEPARTEADPFRRQDKFKEAIRLLERRSALTETPSQIEPDLLARLDAETDKEVKVIEERRRRAEELEAKRQEAAERRETAIREAQERREARAYSPLLCNDGTESPSCTCGGRRQGCCSHHGGVAGCSADR